jgi:enoyl-CoA hydratase
LPFHYANALYREFAMSDAPVTLEISRQVAKITINKFQRRNALDDKSWQLFQQICADISARDDIRIVLLAGEGEHFCAGADIHELREHILDTAWMKRNQAHIATALDAYANLPQITIAMIHGCCYGGGAALAVSSDFRVAADSARFAITPAKLGLTYRLVDCLRLHQLIGPSRTREMLLMAAEVDGATALSWGLVNDCVVKSAMETATNIRIDKLLSLSAYSQRGIKTTLLKIRDGAQDDDDETRRTFAAAFSGNDFISAAASFAQKPTKPT